MTEHYKNPPPEEHEKPTIYNETITGYLDDNGTARITFYFSADPSTDDILRILVCSLCMKIGIRSIHDIGKYGFHGWQTKYPILCEECNGS